MMTIPRIKRRIDLVDALCMIAEDAATFDLLDTSSLNALHKVIEEARKHTRQRVN